MWLACYVTLVYICHWSNRPAEAEYMTVYFHCYRGISSSLEASFRNSNDKVWAHALSASFTGPQRILVINIFPENRITINWNQVKHLWADLAKNCVVHPSGIRRPSWIASMSFLGAEATLSTFFSKWCMGFYLSDLANAPSGVLILYGADVNG